MSENLKSFQDRTGEWSDVCFEHEIVLLERLDRFVEEVLETTQALYPAYSAERVDKIANYVFARPVGEPKQEVGGVMVCLALVCRLANIDMLTAGEEELARVWTKIEQIRAKNKAKPSFDSPLPGNVENPIG